MGHNLRYESSSDSIFCCFINDRHCGMFFVLLWWEYASDDDAS